MPERSAPSHQGPAIAQPKESFVARRESPAPAAAEPTVPSPAQFTPSRSRQRALGSPSRRPRPRQVAVRERTETARDAARARVPSPDRARRRASPGAAARGAEPSCRTLPTAVAFRHAEEDRDRDPRRDRGDRARRRARGSPTWRASRSAQGYWGSPDDYHEKYHHVLVGKTGLALLAFLGAGHTPDSGTLYSQNARRAIDFLIDIQDSRTAHFGDTSSYSHGIATYALAECYAIEGEERLREPDRAWSAPHPAASRSGAATSARTEGGATSIPTATRSTPGRASRSPRGRSWRSSPRGWGTSPFPTSPSRAAREYLLRSWDRRMGAFRYSHDPVRLRSDYYTLPGSTPAALFALSLLGEDIRNSRYEDARRYVVERSPRGYRFTTSDDFVLEARGNLYFWYYGSLALLRSGGQRVEPLEHRHAGDPAPGPAARRLLGPDRRLRGLRRRRRPTTAATRPRCAS